ncbi:unnamed protein product [Hymenolepis diminuta]|uniref:Uncharacterized protein n=1 Tax=Hymenolepis diminuta TaxID=6216 RepID=A0A564YQR8_HYMDI|nr:unnamed protein product [Hymenolepis diminuta]
MPWSVYVRVKPMLVCSTKRQILVDDTCNDPEEIVLADSVPNTKGTILEVVAKNVGEATLTSTQNPICSQTSILWSLSDLSLAGPNPEMPYQIYSK